MMSNNGWREALTTALLDGDVSALTLVALARRAAIGAEGAGIEDILLWTGKLAEAHPHIGEAMREKMKNLSHMPY
jgi:hypothetical protein